jgi:hypothetical protein
MKASEIYRFLYISPANTHSHLFDMSTDPKECQPYKKRSCCDIFVAKKIFQLGEKDRHQNSVRVTRQRITGLKKTVHFLQICQYNLNLTKYLYDGCTIDSS